MRDAFARGASAWVVSALVAGAVLAADAPKSGLEIGDFASPFEVRDITGPNQGDTLCYR